MKKSPGAEAGHEGSGATAVNDQPVSEVIGRYSNPNSVTREHSDVVTTHAAGQLGANEGSALIDLDGILTAT